MKTVGVVLSGCGVLDGAEIHESVLTMLALDRAGAEVLFFAPDKPQLHVINHITGEIVAEERKRFSGVCPHCPWPDHPPFCG